MGFAAPSKGDHMKALLGLSGHIAAAVGALACLVGGVARLAGHYYLGGFQDMSLFMGGIGLMVFACLAKLYALPARV